MAPIASRLLAEAIVWSLPTAVLASICLSLLLASSVAVSAEEAKKKISDADLQKAVVEYNSDVANTDDEVVCKKEPVTGSRQKKRETKGPSDKDAFKMQFE